MNAISGYDFVKAILARNKNYPVEALLEHAGNSECDYLELKATVEVKPEECDKGETPRDIYWNIARELIAMINSRGGILIIGISDKPDHTVIPLESRDSHNYFRDRDPDAYYRLAIERHIVPDTLTWTYKNKKFQTSQNIANYLERQKLNYGGRTVFAYLVRPCEEGEFISVTTSYIDHGGCPGPEELYRRLPGPIGECECLTSFAGFKDHIEHRVFKDELLAAELNRLSETPYQMILNTLPPQNKDFVGREEDLERLSCLIQCGRIPVLHGEGGVGKTELACEFAYRNIRKFGGGCFFIDMKGVFHYEELADVLYANQKVKAALGPIAEGEKRTDWILSKLLAYLERGSILVILDNFENVRSLSYNELINSPIKDHLDGASRVCIIATTREADAKMFPKNSSERAEVIELNALSPEAAAQLLRSRLPDDIQIDDKGQMAIAEIVRLLGHHAWRTEITGGYLSQNYQDYGNPPFAAYLKELQESGWDLQSETPTFRKNGPSTKDLLKPTISKLEKIGQDGRNAIALAECLSKFPLSGVTEGPLIYIWEHVLRKGKDLIGFRKALGLLSKYALISRRRDGERIRMHQLTHDFFLTRKGLSANDISKALAKDPNCPVRYWAELARDNQLMRHCPWNRLPGSVNRDIILTDPTSFSSKIRWNTLDGYALADILINEPELAKHVKSFEPLYESDPEMPCMAFARLLALQPDPFAEKCDFSRLKCRDVVHILKSQPKLHAYCLETIKSFSPSEWSALLSQQHTLLTDAPGISDMCPWEDFEVDDWSRIIAHRPDLQNDAHFTSRFCMADLPPLSWVRLIIRHRDRFLLHPDCPYIRIAKDSDSVVDLISAAPWILEQRNATGNLLFSFNFTKLPAEGWVRILSTQPQLYDLATRHDVWRTLSGKDWANLLSVCPQFLDKCDHAKLDGNDWAQILDKQPQIIEKLPEQDISAIWKIMLGVPHGEFLSPIIRVLFSHPEFADTHRGIDFSRLSETGNRILLSRIPSLRQNIKSNEFSPHEYARLIMEDPSSENIKNGQLDNINDLDRSVIAVLHPQLTPENPSMLVRNLLMDKNRLRAISDLFWDIDEARMTHNVSKTISAASALAWIYFTHGFRAEAQLYTDILLKCLRKHADPVNRKPLYVNIAPDTLLHNTKTMISLQPSSVPIGPDFHATLFIYRFARSKTPAARKLIPSLRKAINRSKADITLVDEFMPADKRSEKRLAEAHKKGRTILLIQQEGLPDYVPLGKLRQNLTSFHEIQKSLWENHLFDKIVTFPPMLLGEVPDSCGTVVLHSVMGQERMAHPA